MWRIIAFWLATVAVAAAISAGDRIVYTAFSSDGSAGEYYHPDHLHSAQVMSTNSGALTQHYEYTAYGNTRYTFSTNAFPLSRRYTSQVLDEDTGLYYYGSRYYDPVLGRFVQPDTIIPNRFDPQAYDRYAYARDNPMRYVDPSGHAPSQWADAMQPAIDSYYGGYVSDPSHTSTMGLWGAYMGQSIANGYNDMLRFGTGFEQGTATGIAQDIGRGSAMVLTVAGPAESTAMKLAPANPAVPDVASAPEATPVPRTGPRGVDPAHHNANVTVRDADGGIISHSRLVSGNMTPEEQALGFPKNTLASHTEARAVKQTALEKGQSMTITGQNAPCPTCKGAMNKAAGETGATIKYQWRDNGRTQTWQANSPKDD